MSLVAELKRRNVFRVGLAYAIAAWLIMQVLEIVLESFGSPAWVMKTVIVVLAAGLPLALIFAWAFELTPEGIKREKDVDRTQSITHKTGRKLDRMIIAVLAAAVVVLLVDRFMGSQIGPAPATGTASASKSGSDSGSEAQGNPVPAEKSVAVLPFVNMSSDPEQEYFSDGISEEILNSLARVRDLKVAGRTSSFAFKGENKDLREIGQTLGVENILEGSVRKSGTKVRITAQLIQVGDGFHLWSESYDRELDDVFAIQDEIASAILEQLKAHLLDGERAALASTRANSEAYDLYLLAKQRIYVRSKPTLESAVDLLDQAIGIDPQYAPAYAQRAITTLLLSDEDYGTIPAEKAEAQALTYVKQAVDLDPEDPEVLAASGLYQMNRPGKTDEAIAALERALEINPNLVNASNWLQAAYARAGRIEEAVEVLETLVERDPLYRPGVANVTSWWVNRGQIDKARALIERIRPSMPNDPFLLRMESSVLYASAEYAKGLRLAEKALALRPNHYPNQDAVGQGLLVTGQYERLAAEGHPWQRIIALQALGRLEEAILLAQQEAGKGDDVGSLIGLLANSGRPEEAVEFIEDRWDSLDAYEADYPLLGGGGVDTMLDIALAYSLTGNQARFDDAMARTRNGLDRLYAMGMQNDFLPLLDAVWHTLTGDPNGALELLDTAVDRGFIAAARLSDAWAALKALDGDPEFEGIQARMWEHLNEERAELGLEPYLT
ncbi:tetratricopeptide repeat protein [Elongatibacter sediminis]|uniref:Tetratricopeptide repeat protein n=1 Tax=Elongatibacter sediminis TaxID=3119006 RepID=A0AAW9RPU5_9GAMM